jgi:YHS domain-containing protein
VEDAAARLDVKQCRQLANDCLRAKTSRDVRLILNDSELVKKHRAVCHPRWDQAVDPICEAVVDTAEGNLTLTRRGKKVHFCSAQCRDEYIRREQHDYSCVAQAC